MRLHLILSNVAFGKWRVFATRGFALILIFLTCGTGSFAHSVLTHEEIIDLLWTDEIKPLLLQRYPGLTEDQIKEAATTFKAVLHTAANFGGEEVVQL